MHGLIFETSVCYWQNQPGYYLFLCRQLLACLMMMIVQERRKENHSFILSWTRNQIKSDKKSEFTKKQKTSSLPCLNNQSKQDKKQVAASSNTIETPCSNITKLGPKRIQQQQMKCKQTCSLAEKSHSSLLRGHVASCCKTQRRDCYSQFTANGASNPFSSWQVILSMMRITIHPFPIDWTIFHPKVEPQDVGKLLGRSKPLPWDTTQLTSHCLTDWQLTDRQTTGTKPCGCQCRGISLLVRRFGSKQSHTQANNTNNKFPWSWSCFLGFTFFWTQQSSSYIYQTPWRTRGVYPPLYTGQKPGCATKKA